MMRAVGDVAPPRVPPGVALEVGVPADEWAAVCARASSWPEALVRGEGVRLGARLDGALVGTALASVDGESLLVSAVAVLPTCRRRGLAAALVAAALQVGVEAGARTCIVD